MSLSRSFRRPLRLTTPRLAHTFALLFVVFLGVALRVYRLDAQSLWYDEGNSARIAERSLQLIIEGAAGDIHPPLYYILLHYWRALFGADEAALRSLSVVAGVLLIGFTYLIGRMLFNPRTGLVAAFLVAVSPFAVYYSQEARMYILLALEAAISTWALVELGSRGALAREQGSQPSRRFYVLRLTLYVIATAAGLYTQYAYPFVMIAQGVCVLLWLVFTRQNRLRAWRALRVYAFANIIAIALFLPWLPVAVRQITSWAVTPQDYDLGAATLDAYRWLVAGRTILPEQEPLPMAVIGGLALIALLLDVGQVLRRSTSVDRSRLLRAFTLLILTALPFALLFVFKLYREAYLKFLLVCAPPLLILAAHGIDGIVRVAFRGSSVLRRLRAPGALVLALLAAFALAPSLDNLYSDPAFARDDYRGIARMVEQDARPGDAILFNAPNQWEVFTYYHHEGAPAIALPYRPDNEAVVEEALRPIAAQYTRLFVLYYGERESDPDGLFERWLALNTFKADEQWIGNIRLAVYATRQPSQVLDVTAAFGDGITLLRARADLSPHNVGDLIPLELRWRGDQPLAQRYKVFVHLGPSDAPPAAQNDAEPASGFQPTTAWQPGEEVIDRRAVWIKTSAPPGSYGLYVGMYDSATGQRLPITRDGQSVGDRLWLGDMIVR